jgi:TetR/AcrR family transcriptional regulator, regulator of cefoperazone and chloramphenicol sensitivity
MDLLAANGPTVTVGAIAEAAGVYPNQITHHFGTRDALFAEAAFTLLLHDTERLESSVRRMRTPETFRDAIARTALATPSVGLVVAALGRRDGDPITARTVQRCLEILFRQSERFLERVLSERGWISDNGTHRDVRSFWSAIFGAVLVVQSEFPGAAGDVALGATLSIRVQR